ncbi:HlyD family efflux transporter periplasmic adaptor subunit [Pseudoalteromonas sp. MMG007]|uniref:efflux RND transporter periplasmic adaptor subunit n=1 Tax=Pseudoalteromonas sp. MMG007 TaxID=2822684 RepID=UPI001B37FD1B|nr:HlyD family efflux transporter periplasmic adaptor subunit [Pseudoalteromonas sp. MMG007]MBQ4859991.1 HlyD family efflux transporter periplasmic adaptor subunit [Pseudoalteromonas sp. MMG007]
MTDTVVRREGRNFVDFVCRKIILVPVALVILGTTYSFKNIVFTNIEKEGLNISKVLSGDLPISVDAYGIVDSNEPQLISARTRATVKQILIKPGVEVKVGDLLVVLEDQELLMRVKSARREVTKVESDLKELVLKNQREILLEDFELTEIKSEYEFAKLQREAEEKLVDAGIISKLSFSHSVLAEKQLTKRITLLQKRIEQLKEVQKAQIDILKERVEQSKDALAFEISLLESLNVKAPVNGVLQRLPIEVGENIDAGQEIGVIGSAENLIASLRVPQSKAHLINIGQNVLVKTKNREITGSVIRIDPVVDNNTVIIESSLSLTSDIKLRPRQNIDASIVIAQLKNVKYIENPQTVKENQSIGIYKLNAKEDLATLHTIRFGEKSGNFIRILSGASVGEKLITSSIDVSDNQITLQ